MSMIRIPKGEAIPLSFPQGVREMPIVFGNSQFVLERGQRFYLNGVETSDSHVIQNGRNIIARAPANLKLPERPEMQQSGSRTPPGRRGMRGMLDRVTGSGPKAQSFATDSDRAQHQQALADYQKKMQQHKGVIYLDQRDHPMVSRKHAVIDMLDLNTITVTDLSSNGTYVDERYVVNKRTESYRRYLELAGVLNEDVFHSAVDIEEDEELARILELAGV